MQHHNTINILCEIKWVRWYECDFSSWFSSTSNGLKVQNLSIEFQSKFKLIKAILITMIGFLVQNQLKECIFFHSEKPWNFRFVIECSKTTGEANAWSATFSHIFMNCNILFDFQQTYRKRNAIYVLIPLINIANVIFKFNYPPGYDLVIRILMRLLISASECKQNYLIHEM